MESGPEFDSLHPFFFAVFGHTDISTGTNTTEHEPVLVPTAFAIIISRDTPDTDFAGYPA
jgi:hypothetical protein